jgi:hypothetical protein
MHIMLPIMERLWELPGFPHAVNFTFKSLRGQQPVLPAEHEETVQWLMKNQKKKPGQVLLTRKEALSKISRYMNDVVKGAGRGRLQPKYILSAEQKVAQKNTQKDWNETTENGLQHQIRCLAKLATVVFDTAAVDPALAPSVSAQGAHLLYLEIFMRTPSMRATMLARFNKSIADKSDWNTLSSEQMR